MSVLVKFDYQKLTRLFPMIKLDRLTVTGHANIQRYQIIWSCVGIINKPHSFF